MFQRCAWFLGLTVWLFTGCATTTTQLPDISPEQVVEEERIQRALVLSELSEAQQRLDDLVAPLLEAALPLCPDRVSSWMGFRYHTLSDYRGQWRDAAAEAFNVGDTVTVSMVTQSSPAFLAGLRAGDRVLEARGEPIPGSVSALQAALLDVGPHDEVSMVVMRGEQVDTLTVVPRERCGFGHEVIVDGDINAFADGDRIIFPWAMMRFAEDDELLVVISHEIAHNVMGHIEAKKRNMLWAGILGAVADVSLAGQGVATGGSYTEEFMRLGATAYSQDFEREADYVGMYILARAGIRLEEAGEFWRRFAQINPAAIGYASSHPTTAERFVRLREAAREIDEKRAAGVDLLPELRGGGL